MTPVEVLPPALDEFEAAVDWYEAQAPGVGARLADAVEEVLLEIGRQPNFYPRWEFDEQFRKAKIQRFPYAVYYLQDNDVVYVIAVAHGHREPGYWRSRTG